MGLSKYRIGQLIKVVDERNSFEITDFYGININKAFMPTVANTEGLNETNYKVVRKNRFVFQVCRQVEMSVFALVCTRRIIQ